MKFFAVLLTMTIGAAACGSRQSGKTSSRTPTEQVTMDEQ